MDNTQDPNNPYPPKPIYNSSNPPVADPTATNPLPSTPPVDPLSTPPPDAGTTDPFSLPTVTPQVTPAPASPPTPSPIPTSPDPLLNSTLPPEAANTFTPPPSSPALDNAISSWQQTPPASPPSPQPIPASPVPEAPLANSLPADISATPASVDSYTATPTMPVSQTTPADINAALGAPVDTSPVPTWPPPSVNQTADQAVDQTSTPSFEQIPPQTASTSFEPAPTDLSQLTGTTPPPPQPVESYNPVTPTDNIVVPQPEQAAPETTTAQPFPLKLVIGGVITLLVITAASIYFFFFATKPPTPTQSSDSESQIPLNPPAVVPEVPVASSSANTTESPSSFGTLIPPEATPSSKPTSAIDALKQRQSQ